MSKTSGGPTALGRHTGNRTTGPVGPGDAGSGSHTIVNGQNTATLLGSKLRVDVPEETLDRTLQSTVR